MAPPVEVTLELSPQARFDLIDVRRLVAAEVGEFLTRYSRAIYCSPHTTAGYLEQSLCARLRYNPNSVSKFMQVFRKLFPPNADYQHDQLALRNELSEEQRRHEPRNGDSHLAFIGSGLRNCATYSNRSPDPVYFIDLDGVNEHTVRRRRTKRACTGAVPLCTTCIHPILTMLTRMGYFRVRGWTGGCSFSRIPLRFALT